MKKKIIAILIIAMTFSLMSCKSYRKEKVEMKPFSDMVTNNNYLIKRIEEINTLKEKEWKKDHLIATARTYFNHNQSERSNNIRLAAESIDGMILKKGEIFSFNEVVGKRTIERGYLPADIFVSRGGEVITSKAPGGGICQTSSTLCMAIQNTTMQILERNTHSIGVVYCLPEQEAMINWGTSDFKFINSNDFDIKIEFVIREADETYDEICCNIYSM